MNKKIIVTLGAVAIGLWSPIQAMADPVNSYFSTQMAPASTACTDRTFSSPVLIEQSSGACADRTFSAPVVIEKRYSSGACTDRTLSSPVVLEKSYSSPVCVDRTFSSPVIIDKTGSAPVVIEDRIIKQKHMFGIGIWPLFDFEVM